MPVTLTTASRPHLPQTVKPGVTPSIKLSPVLKTPAEPPSREKGAGERTVMLQYQTQTRPLTAATATGPARPILALPATSAQYGLPLYNVCLQSQAMVIFC